MSRIGEEGSSETLIEYSTRRTRRLVDGFVEFATEGNVLEIAFGLIVAAAFTNVVTSFVSDIILPPLSVLLPLNANLDFKFAVLQAGPNYQRWGGYNTIEQAQDDGAVVMAYGVFLNKSINFVGLGLALYALAGLYQYLCRDPIIKHTVLCRYCGKKIYEESLRCVNCTSWLDGREDLVQLRAREDLVQLR
ncbi:Large-conductance mechanosensitive channel [Cytospora mali]|uniref:Large-conductance mechanosensitive channel n=1 Tax=Cytospora mali TaxID=578113 RepID=A0A194UPZ5_CYTMA|nr:Large-conductance mechanosensitive channel [Valsa mali var. pyri (nom. inval.)]